MANTVKKHSDCENFAFVDVAKGICRLTKERVLIDSAVCGKFEQIPTCGQCAAFKNPNADGIGLCQGLSKEYWTDEHYHAALCEGYASGK